MPKGVYERTAQHLIGIRQRAEKRRKYPLIQSGDTFGFWTIIEKGLLKKNGQRWFCRCSCGFEKDVLESHLLLRKSTKCRRCSGLQKSLKNLGRYSDNRRTEHVRLCVGKLYQDQKGMCPLCGEQLPELSKCAWDHDHVSGEGRALLHKGCNVFLGFVERYSEILERTRKYCESYKIKT